MMAGWTDGQPWMIVSDLDGTLLGDDAALAAFADWAATQREHLRLAYSSGRFYDSICASIRTTRLPDPDAVIGGVGTDMRSYPSGELIPGWRERLARGWDGEAVRRVLGAETDIELQAPGDQSEFKASFFLYGADDARIKALRALLRGAALEVNIVYSSGRDLDVLPAGCDKGAAAAYLAAHWGIPAERVVACGDSGNDASMMTAGFRGIVVGNAQPELRAVQGPDVYHAARHCAAGVLEGLRHWTGAR